MNAAAAEALLTQLLSNLPAVAAAGGSGGSKQLEEQEGSMLAVGACAGAESCRCGHAGMERCVSGLCVAG